MNFTGSNWCGFCKKLKAEVFNTDVFKKSVPEHFLLVELDFPKPNELPKETQKQNEEWMIKFYVQGFPTVVVVDVKGRPVAADFFPLKR
jgi:thioredoxin-related protein